MKTKNLAEMATEIYSLIHELSKDERSRVINAALILLGDQPSISSSSSTNSLSNTTSVSKEEKKEVPESFGEWLHQFQDDISDTDKGLITAQYVQSLSQTNDFKTSDVNKSLKEHGIKLSNPSVSLNRLVSKKHLFQTRKVGTLKFYRVSADGQKHLNTLKTENSAA